MTVRASLLCCLVCLTLAEPAAADDRTPQRPRDREAPSKTKPDPVKPKTVKPKPVKPKPVKPKPAKPRKPVKTKPRPKLEIKLPEMAVWNGVVGGSRTMMATVRPRLRADSWVSYRLLWRHSARTDYKPQVTFEIPAMFRNAPVRVRIAGRNADTVSQFAQVQFQGLGRVRLRVRSKRIATGVIQLDKVKVPRPGGKRTPLAKLLAKGTRQAVSAWMTTEARHGYGSWVSLELEFRLAY